MEKPIVLMLESDADDRYITQTVLADNDIDADIRFMNNSDDFLSYINDNRTRSETHPSLILLDLNAVPLNAQKILAQIKSSSEYNHIPVVILSGAGNERLVKEYYALGASSFIIKPDSHDLTNKKIINFFRYWFETVELA